jgi:predicted HD superfamily hydrolase involved in NAD metabolism
LTLILTDDRRVEIRSWLQERLSPHRYTHSLGVAATARELASRYGADPEKAELSGLLHDIAREWRPPELLAAAQDWEIPVGYLEEMAPMPCLHGPVGASVAADVFQVNDEAVLLAIAHHTMGRERMTLLERVLFLADAIEPNRPEMDYIRELRDLAPQDLNRACRRAYDYTFEYLLRTGQPIHPEAARGRNWLLYEERELNRLSQEK